MDHASCLARAQSATTVELQNAPANPPYVVFSNTSRHEYINANKATAKSG
jgi:hypothetical protein